MTTKFSVTAWIAMLGAAFVLTGCEVGDRPLEYKPGTYQGQDDQKLSDETVKELSDRAKLQN